MIEAYKELGQLTVSTATGGSTTTVVDSKQVGIHGDNSWKEGGIFIVRDAGGANAAPEGEFKRCSGYTDSTGTFTVESVFTVSPASGDTFGFVSEYYPLFTMLELANSALYALGDIPLVDTTTLTTAAAQTEYAAAVAWKRRPPYRVDIQSITNDSNNNRWVTLHGWEYVPATAGSTGLIVFNDQPPTSRKLRIWYKDVHPTLTAYNSTLYEGWPPLLAHWAVVAKALEWQNARSGGSEAFLLDKLNKSEQKLAEARALQPVWTPKSQPRLLILSDADNAANQDYFTYPSA